MSKDIKITCFTRQRAKGTTGFRKYRHLGKQLHPFRRAFSINLLSAREVFFFFFSPFSLFSFSLSFSRFCPFCSSLKICNNLIESEDRRIVTDSLCQYYNYWDYYVKSSTMLTLRINASLALKWQRSGQNGKKKDKDFVMKLLTGLKTFVKAMSLVY